MIALPGICVCRKLVSCTTTQLLYVQAWMQHHSTAVITAVVHAHAHAHAPCCQHTTVDMLATLALRSFGFHFLSLANNHILDYCTQGLEETRQVSAGLGAPAVSC